MSVTTSALRRGFAASAAVGIAAFLSLGGAQAGPSHHHRHAAAPLDREFNADTSIGLPPQAAAPVVGAWRYNLLRHGCDSSYPMVGRSCGTATGGPVGGLGS